jgi:hypothetical protein
MRAMLRLLLLSLRPAEGRDPVLSFPGCEKLSSFDCMLRRDAEGGLGSDQLERLMVETPPGGFIPLLPGCPLS